MEQRIKELEERVAKLEATLKKIARLIEPDLDTSEKYYKHEGL